SHDDLRVPSLAPEGTRGALRADPEALPERRPGEARSRVSRRHEGEGERVEAQGDELRAHDPGRKEAPSRSEALARRGRARGRRRQRETRKEQARRRASRLGREQGEETREDSGGEASARAGGQGRSRADRGRTGGEGARARSRHERLPSESARWRTGAEGSDELHRSREPGDEG